MHDLTGAHARLTDVYRKYIDSAFPLRYPRMVEERRELYARSDILRQRPLLEPTPVYPSSGSTLADAAETPPSQYADLAGLRQRDVGRRGHPPLAAPVGESEVRPGGRRRPRRDHRHRIGRNGALSPARTRGDRAGVGGVAPAAISRPTGIPYTRCR